MSRLWPWIVVSSSVTVVTLVLLDVDSAIRPLVVIGFLIVAPGMAIVRVLKIPDRIAELTLGIALSAAVDGIVPGVLMYAGFWSSELALLIVVAITLAATFSEARSPRRASQRTEHVAKTLRASPEPASDVSDPIDEEIASLLESVSSKDETQAAVMDEDAAP